MLARPTGTVTFLFTDIEGSTRLWEHFPQAMQIALARHDALLREAIEANQGYVFKTIGDAFCAAFPTATDGLAAALAAQRALFRETWNKETGRLKVRMALHTGTVEERQGDYFGPVVNRVARLLSAGYGDQTLLSGAAQELVCKQLPPDIQLRDLGERRLKDLVRPEHVYQVIAPDLPTEFPPLKSLDVLPNNLPVQVTSFIGRETEMAEIKRLISPLDPANSAVRLLTLTGPGGAGKTRLSLQVAADLLDSFPDGVWFVELALLNEPGLMPQAVAGVLGIREEPNRPLLTTITNHLRGKRLLLILDNCEHIVDEAARFAEAIQRSCPGVQILASSREALGIAGEVSLPIPSLALPDPQQLPPLEKLAGYEAVRLFVERAKAVQPNFNLTEQNAQAVVRICEQLDGIPLALELAAARVKVLAVDQIATRLDDRFRLLTGGSRTALPRQQTLKALIDWSYDLLSEGEQTFLLRLSVFAGGWSLEAAETICAGEGIVKEEILDLLRQLVNKSLVMVEEDHGEARYRMLGTIRQYAREKQISLAETGLELIRQNHAEYYAGLANQAEGQLRGAEQGEWLDRLELEHDNLRAALSWLLSAKAKDKDGEIGGLTTITRRLSSELLLMSPAERHEMALRLVGSLWQFWLIHGHLSEGRRWLETALALPANGSSRSIVSLRAKAFNGAGFLTYEQGDYERAIGLLEQGLDLRRKLRDKRGIASSLNNLGNVAYSMNDYDRARAFYQESLALQRELGNQQGIASSLANLGLVAHAQGNDADAKILYEQNLALVRELGDTRAIALTLCNLGNMASTQNEYEKAQALYHESLVLRREIGDKSGMPDCLEGLAGVARAQGKAERAVCLLCAAEILREAIGLFPAEYRAEYERVWNILRTQLSEPGFSIAQAASRSMTLEEIIDYALNPE